MDAVFRVNANEFDEKLFDKIKSILSLKQNLEVTISISDSSAGIHRHETKQEYFERLLTAKDNLENNKNVITYKAGDFDEFEKLLAREP